MMKETSILLSRLHLTVIKLKQPQESSRDCVGNMHFGFHPKGSETFLDKQFSQFSRCLWGSTELKTLGRRPTTGHRRPRAQNVEHEWVRAGRRKYTSLGLQISPGLACFWLLCAQMTNWVARMIVDAKELNLGNPGALRTPGWRVIKRWRQMFANGSPVTVITLPLIISSSTPALPRRKRS